MASGKQTLPQTAIILAGGLGTRLRQAIGERPKVLAEVEGRPFLDYLLTYLAEQGIRRAILALGYQAKMVQNFAGTGSFWGLKIEYIEEQTPLGTGGALRYATTILETEGSSTPFFVLNGDTLFMISLKSLWQFHQSFHYLLKSQGQSELSNLFATMALREIPLEPDEISQRGTVLLSPEGRIISFEEKKRSAPLQNPTVLINGGVYIFSPQGLADIPLGQAISLEREVFPALASQSRLAGLVTSGYFIDIGVPKNLARFEEDIRKGRLKWSKE